MCRKPRRVNRCILLSNHQSLLVYWRETRIIIYALPFTVGNYYSKSYLPVSEDVGKEPSILQSKNIKVK